MKVYLGYETLKDDYKVWDEVVKVFYSKESASRWVEDDILFRDYKEMEVEYESPSLP